MCQLYSCEKCKGKFNEEKELKTHESICYKTLHCNHCNKDFSNTSNLKKHLKRVQNNPPVEIHDNIGSKTFQCKLCGNYYSNNSNLKKHINKVHEKPGRKAFWIALYHLL